VPEPQSAEFRRNGPASAGARRETVKSADTSDAPRLLFKFDSPIVMVGPGTGSGHGCPVRIRLSLIVMVGEGHCCPV
jgi:hypothetical protein